MIDKCEKPLHFVGEEVVGTLEKRKFIYSLKYFGGCKKRITVSVTLVADILHRVWNEFGYLLVLRR